MLSDRLWMGWRQIVAQFEMYLRRIDGPMRIIRSFDSVSHQLRESVHDFWRIWSPSCCQLFAHVDHTGRDNIAGKVHQCVWIAASGTRNW